MVFDHCRSSSGNPWIGLHDANDNDVFVWLNGNILPDDDENWRNGCIFLIVVIIFKGLYYIIRDFRPGPYSARSVNFVLNKTVLLRDRKSRTAHALCLVMSKLFIRPKKKIWKEKKNFQIFFRNFFQGRGGTPICKGIPYSPSNPLPPHLDLGLQGHSLPPGPWVREHTPTPSPPPGPWIRWPPYTPPHLELWLGAPTRPDFCWQNLELQDTPCIEPDIWHLHGGKVWNYRGRPPPVDRHTKWKHYLPSHSLCGR